jgi:hypothetical protein
MTQFRNGKVMEMVAKTTEIEIADARMDAETIGLTLFGQPVTVKKGGLLDSETSVQTSTVKKTPIKETEVQHGIIIDDIKALATLDMWSPDRERKYCSSGNHRHLLTEKGRAREAFKSFAREINGWKLHKDTLWVIDQLDTKDVKEYTDGELKMYRQTVSIIQILTHKASKKIVDNQPLAEHPQYIQLLPDFEQVGWQFLLADFERRLIRGEDIKTPSEYIARDGSTKMSYVPRNSIGLVSMMMHAEWAKLFHRYNISGQWDEEYDTQERPVSNHTLQHFEGQDGLKELFEYAGLSPNHQRYLFAYIEGKVGEHLTDGSLADIARWMGVTPQAVQQGIAKALANLTSANVFGEDDDVMHISKIKARNKFTRKERKDHNQYLAKMKDTYELIDIFKRHPDADAYPTTPVTSRKTKDMSRWVATSVDEFDPCTE